MSKALVIKGVNFTANALTQVTFGDDVPCTGLALNETAKSVTNLEPFTLTATKTPANTTDTLTWSSSDETVATVANGVVTLLKGGTATITATCGMQTATCSVTVHVLIDLHMTYHYMFEPKNTGGQIDTVGVGGSATNTTYGGTVDTTGSGKYAYDSSNKLGGDKAYQIMLPVGCKALKIELPDQSMRSVISWCATSITSAGYGTHYIKCLQHDASVWQGIAGDRTENVPDIEGIDSFYLSVYLSGTTLNQDMLDEITVEALYEAVNE